MPKKGLKLPPSETRQQCCCSNEPFKYRSKTRILLIFPTVRILLRGGRCRRRGVHVVEEVRRDAAEGRGRGGGGGEGGVQVGAHALLVAAHDGGGGGRGGGGGGGRGRELEVLGVGGGGGSAAAISLLLVAQTEKFLEFIEIYCNKCFRFFHGQSTG